MAKKYYLTREDMVFLGKQFSSTEKFADFLESQNIDAYESREAFELRMRVQEFVDAQPWTKAIPPLEWNSILTKRGWPLWNVYQS